jgi:acetyltransferase-like isoleucine patch superfamily enzyme
MIHLGRHSYNYGVQRGTCNNVYIGAFSSIAEGVRFDGGFVHPPDFVSTYPFKNIWSELEVEGNPRCNGDIHIGNDVTIGEGAIIMSGISIGDGAVIGANTIVNNHVEPFSVMVGAPMRFIRYRYSNINLVAPMLKIKWWEWSDEKIRENAYLLNSKNIADFIFKHYTP